MLGQLDMAGHPEVGLGLLLVMATAIAPDAAPDDIALVALMMDVGVGIALVVAEPQVCLLHSLQPQLAQIYEWIFRYVYDTKTGRCLISARRPADKIFNQWNYFSSAVVVYSSIVPFSTVLSGKVF